MQVLRQVSFSLGVICMFVYIYIYICVCMYVSEVALNFNFFCHFDGQGRKNPS